MELLTLITWGRLLLPVAQKGHRAYKFWRNIDNRMPEVSKAFHKVRCELCEAGLLDEDVYLDVIDLEIASIPSICGEAGYVFEETGLITGLFGYEPGTIYLPSNIPSSAYVPGGTLTDVIRHEFAHSWHWLDPEYLEEDWFEDTFGYEYTDYTDTPYQDHVAVLWGDAEFVGGMDRRRTEETRLKYLGDHLLKEFVSGYAMENSSEDFAEVFMSYLRNRNSLHRFKSRPGVYRKLKAVERAVKRKKKQLKL